MKRWRNLKEKLETLEKNQMRVLELKVKDLLKLKIYGKDLTYWQLRKKAHEFQDMSIEIIQCEEKREKNDF